MKIIVGVILFIYGVFCKEPSVYFHDAVVINKCLSIDLQGDFNIGDKVWFSSTTCDIKSALANDNTQCPSVIEYTFGRFPPAISSPSAPGLYSLCLNNEPIASFEILGDDFERKPCTVAEDCFDDDNCTIYICFSSGVCGSIPNPNCTTTTSSLTTTSTTGCIGASCTTTISFTTSSSSTSSISSSTSSLVTTGTISTAITTTSGATTSDTTNSISITYFALYNYYSDSPTILYTFNENISLIFPSMDNAYARIELATSDYPNFADPSLGSTPGEYVGLSFFVTIVGNDLLTPIQPSSKITFVLGSGGFQDGDDLYLYDTINRQWTPASCSQSIVSHGVYFTQVCHLTQFALFRINKLTSTSYQESSRTTTSSLYFILAIVLPIVITLLVIGLIIYIVKSSKKEPQVKDEESLEHMTKPISKFQEISESHVNIEMKIAKEKELKILDKKYDSTLSSNDSSNSSASSLSDFTTSSSSYYATNEDFPLHN